MSLVPFSSRPKATPMLPAFDGLLSNISLLERLDDLRKRLVRSAIAVAVAVLLGFAFINQVVDFLLGPTRRSLPKGAKLIYTQPG